MKRRKKRTRSPEEDPAGRKKFCEGDQQNMRTQNKRSRSPEKNPAEGRKSKKTREDAKRTPSFDITNYSAMAELGKGSFGRVILASYDINDQLVAVKVIQKKQEKDFRYIRREAKILQIAGGCPFLCRAFATFQTESLILFVLEYINGGTMDKLIKRQGQLDTNQILFYSAELIVGLEFLHTNGIVHRDLKPENILMDEEGHVKIGDFGLARTNIFSPETCRGYYGTPGYIAPEVLLDQQHNSGADWWSFGVILYEMATGYLPFNQDTINGQPEYPKCLGAELCDLIHKLLRKNANERLGVYAKVRDHPFYSSTNWVEVEKRALVPPVKPLIRSVKGLSKNDNPFTEDNAGVIRILKNFDYVDPSWQE
uniref:Protein kinase domain-containing protein n=1 Tax=Xenopus tropicalis TaxID=8364 RepID=A0A803JVE3_XENTR